MSIIRTMISSSVRKADTLQLRISLFLYRSLIVVATGLLLSFSLSIPLVENSLSKKLRDEIRTEVLSSKEVADLVADRESFIFKLHRLNAKRYCAGFALTGSKNASETFSPERGKESSSELPPIPIARQNIIRDSLLTLPQISCNEFLDLSEPPCKSKLLSSACPNSFRLSREIYVEASGLLGTEVADRRYALANAVQLFRRAVVSEADSDIGQFKKRIDVVNKKISESESLEVEIPLECKSGVQRTPPGVNQVQPTSPPSGNNLVTAFFVETFRNLLIPKVFRCNSPQVKSKNLDINQVAGVVFEHYSNIFSLSKGMLLVLAVTVIIALFELLVIVLKSSGTLLHLEVLLEQYDRDYREFLKSNTATKLFESEGQLASDFSFVEHLGRLGENLRIVIATHMNSTARCLAVNIPLFFIVGLVMYYALDSFILPFARTVVSVFSIF